MTIETLGVDIAKNVFQLHGVNRNGSVVLKRRVMCDQLLAVLAQILESAGYQVVNAEDDRRGLNVFRAERPDLVIADIIMPEKEGIETIRVIRDECPNAKIVAISGGSRSGNTDYLKLARQLGASGHRDASKKAWPLRAKESRGLKPTPALHLYLGPLDRRNGRHRNLQSAAA